MEKEIKGRLLEYQKGMYRINHFRDFNKIGELGKDDKQTCFDFAYEMCFGDGEHRNHRSGGMYERQAGEIFINTFQGKVSEFAIYRYLSQNGITTPEPDTDVYSLGRWDSFDLKYLDKHIAVKSTKYYGNLLLLETKDWNDNAEYIPNLEIGNRIYDYFVLLRVSPDGDRIMKDNKLLYSNSIDKELLKNIIVNNVWEYDIAGFITYFDLKRLISKKYILPQNTFLNGRTKMDAENYYVQAGDMRGCSELLHRLLKYKHMFEIGLTK